MSKYLVYHSKNMLASLMRDPQRWTANHSDFAYVAAVKASELEEVFTITNHVDGNWTQGPQVIQLGSVPSPRSTSVSDVIVDCNEERTYMVMGQGFQEC